MRDNKKLDSSKNGEGVSVAIERQRSREKNLRPLRINDQTIILVPKKKCTKKYAEEYRNKLRKSLTV